MSAQAWPRVGGRVQVLQPAAGRAGKFTCARHVQPGVTPALGAGGGLACTARGCCGTGDPASLGEGFGSWEECIYGSCCKRGVR